MWFNLKLKNRKKKNKTFFQSKSLPIIFVFSYKNKTYFYKKCHNGIIPL